MNDFFNRTRDNHESGFTSKDAIMNSLHIQQFDTKKRSPFKDPAF